MTQINRIFTQKVVVLTSLILVASHVFAQGADDKSDAPLPLEGKTEMLEFSTTEGSANVLVSPSESSSFSAILRKIRRMILPERVLGNPGAH